MILEILEFEKCWTYLF